MGVRKRKSAEELKEARKHIAFAKLNNCPTSPRKMRLMADLIRGEGVDKALSVLRFSPKESSVRLEKLLLSAVANWQAKNKESDVEKAGLIVKKFVWIAHVCLKDYVRLLRVVRIVFVNAQTMLQWF